MLARHGYGALLFDRRGEGESDGDPNVFGWAGEKDIRAAVEFLRSRPEIDPDRIGGLGLSVGGEMMIEAAAESDGLKAVVSEGAGIRSIREALAIPDAGPRLTSALVHAVVDPRCRVVLEHASAPEPGGSRRPDRAAAGRHHLRDAGPGWRGRALAGVLRRRARAQDDLARPGCRAHGWHRGPAGGVRTTRGRLLRPSAARSPLISRSIARHVVEGSAGRASPVRQVLPRSPWALGLSGQPTVTQTAPSPTATPRGMPPSSMVLAIVVLERVDARDRARRAVGHPGPEPAPTPTPRAPDPTWIDRTADPREGSTRQRISRR